MSKTILFCSQSFYPSIGGVSTLLLALAKYLEQKSYLVESIHLEMPTATKRGSAQHSVIEHVVRREEVSKATYQGYAEFKETIYRHLHDLAPFPFRTINDVPGYSDYMELAAIYSRELQRVVAKREIDLVHFHDYQVMPGIAAVPLGIPSLFSLHAPLLPTLSPVLSSWLLQYWSRTSGVIVSIPAYATVARKIGVKPKNLFTIPPIVDTSVLVQAPEDSPLSQISPDAVVITCIQRFDSKSGQVQLVRAFDILRRRNDSAVLVLVGGKSYTDTIANVRTNYFDEVTALVKELGLDKKVFFVGNVDYYSLGGIYDASHVIVMLSKMECFGLAVSEAMYKALPVVATSVGGLAFQVLDGKSGFRVSVGDVAGTAEALAKLCDSSSLRRRLGKIGRARFISEFAPDKVIPRYVRAYDEIVTSRVRPSYLSVYSSLR